MCEPRSRRVTSDGEVGDHAARIDVVVEVQLPHDFQERRNRLQVSLFQRNVGAAQRLDQPCDLEAGVVLRRIEPSFRQGLTDRATNRRRARLRVARNQLNAVADTSRSKYVSGRPSKASRTFLAEARLRAYSEVGFGPSAAQQEMARDFQHWRSWAKRPRKARTAKTTSRPSFGGKVVILFLVVLVSRAGERRRRHSSHCLVLTSCIDFSAIPLWIGELNADFTSEWL